jgi:hypothetical protein
MNSNPETSGSDEPDVQFGEMVDAEQTAKLPLSLDNQLKKVDSQPPPPITSADILRDREKARSWIAKALVVSSITTVFATFLLIAVDRVSLYMFEKKPTDDGLAKDLITLIWTAQTALVGSALGFYFGDRDST